MVLSTGEGRRIDGRRAARFKLLATTGVASGLLAVLPPLPSIAQSAGAETAQATGQATGQRTFSVPPGSLASALTLLGQQAGLQVSVDPTIVQGVASPGVSGTMSADQALSRLLSGTGIMHRIVGNTVTLQKPGASGLPPGLMQLDPVQVQGAFPVPSQAMIDNIPPPYAGGQVATGGQLGLLGNRGVMDTPFNQTSYTAKKAQDQQAQTVRDVLVDDPSVRSFYPSGGPGIDAFYIRGFPANSVLGAVSYGGMFGMLPNFTIMSELAERVEVLKGPSAMLSGMPPGGFIGGTVNIVPKRATDDPLTQVTANYTSSAQFGAHADVGRRFGPDKQFGVRFNGVFRAGQTAVENNSDERGLGVLGLDFRGERVRLAADLGYQYQYIGGMIPYLGLALGVQLPSAPDARKNLGQSWGYNQRKDAFGVVRAEVDVAEGVTAYAAFGAHDSRVEGLYSTNVIVTNSNGAATSAAPINASQYWTFRTAEAGLRALVDTGPIEHEFGLTASTYYNEAGTGVVSGAAFSTNIYNPTQIARPSIVTPAASKTSTLGLSSLALADTLSAADKRIQLTVGARLQRVTTANYALVTGLQTATYDESAVSPSVSLVLKPWKNVSVYGNWIQGLQQGTVVGSTFANVGEVFPPFKSTQYEAGVKVDWGKLTTTASIFQITQPSTIADLATNTLVLAGEQRNQGLELNAFGEVMEGIRLLGGVMFLSPILTKTQGGATDGWIAPFSPTVQFNLAGEWDLPFAPGLTVNGRVVYTGSQYIDTTLPRRSLAEWTRFDLGIRYAFENPGANGKLLVARFNVDNVLDADYWAGGNAVTTLSLGAPRTFRLSLTADF